jgi:signal transduction histidine kinase
MGTNAHHSVKRVPPKQARKVARQRQTRVQPATALSRRGAPVRGLKRAGHSLREELADYRETERLIHQAYDESQRLLMDHLHEDIGQRLTGIALQAGVLHKNLAKKSHALAQLAYEVANSIGECIALVRDLARGVYPTSLQSGGLGPALDSLAERIHARFKVPCTVTGPQGAKLGPSHCLQIYRLVETALLAAVNTHKADSIAVCYETTPRPHVTISYLVLQASAETAFKADEELQLLRSRARLLGANVRVRNAKKRTVTILFPTA